MHSSPRLKDRLHSFMREMTVDLLKDKTDEVQEKKTIQNEVDIVEG